MYEIFWSFTNITVILKMGLTICKHNVSADRTYVYGPCSGCLVKWFLSFPTWSDLFRYYILIFVHLCSTVHVHDQSMQFL